MNRPARKLKHLQEKIAAKSTRPQRKAGRKLRQWKRNAETYKALVE